MVPPQHRRSLHRTPRRVRWLQPFVLVNGFVSAVALLSSRVACALNLGISGMPIVAEWASCACRDSIIVLFLTRITARKARISASRSKIPQRRAWICLVAIAAPVDASVALLATHLSLRSTETYSVGVPRFVLISFVFELVFDFFHYWTHRLCHSRISPYLARCHAKHHRTHDGLAPISTYDQSLTDVLLCNAIPALLALRFIRVFSPPLSRRDWSFLWTYKSYVEVAGHAGVHSRATSFPQCVWLPRLFGIALRTVDHDLHHTSRGRACNFSKRFTLWDKIFGTYVSASGTKGIAVACAKASRS